MFIQNNDLIANYWIEKNENKAALTTPLFGR